jgi:Peptidase family M41
MNQLSLNAIALSVFAMTMGILLGPLIHLSPTVTASTTLGFLGLVTFDAFKFQSRYVTLLLDSIAQRSPAYRQRVTRHEAGHFFVAHALGLTITDYTLSVWDALRRGVAGGVQVAIPEGADEQWWQENIETLCTVWVAGAIAEELQYGSTEGAEDDYRHLRQTLRQLKLPIAPYEHRAQKQAKSLLKQSWHEYETLVAMMQAQATVVECIDGLKAPSSLH